MTELWQNYDRDYDSYANNIDEWHPGGLEGPRDPAADRLRVHPSHPVPQQKTVVVITTTITRSCITITIIVIITNWLINLPLCFLPAPPLRGWDLDSSHRVCIEIVYMQRAYINK